LRGDVAQCKRGALTLKYPIEHGIVTMGMASITPGLKKTGELTYCDRSPRPWFVGLHCILHIHGIPSFPVPIRGGSNVHVVPWLSVYFGLVANIVEEYILLAALLMGFHLFQFRFGEAQMSKLCPGSQCILAS